MKRMTQILMSCLLAVVILMGSMANAMAATVGQTFTIQPQQRLGEMEVLELKPGQSSFTAQFESAGDTVIAVLGEKCSEKVKILADIPIIRQYNCGPISVVRFLNPGEFPVKISTKY